MNSLFYLDQASFLIERNPIAEDRVIVILKFFRILPVFDLVKGRCAVFGHCILCAGILRLKNSNAISLRVKDYHIAAPFSMLLIGVHLIARSRKNSSQERMVKILFICSVRASALPDQTASNKIFRFQV